MEELSCLSLAKGSLLNHWASSSWHHGACFLVSRQGEQREAGVLQGQGPAWLPPLPAGRKSRQGSVDPGGLDLRLGCVHLSRSLNFHNVKCGPRG